MRLTAIYKRLRGRPLVLAAIFFSLVLGVILVLFGAELRARTIAGSSAASSCKQCSTGQRIRAWLSAFAGSFTAHPTIVGGSSTGQKYPRIGALLLDNRLHCTATLLTNRTAVTAAHCVNGIAVTRLKFRAGSDLRLPPIGSARVFAYLIWSDE